ncbi:Aste57867_24959 [Aphanomyces stellatus]|uniref:Aste57867_24959 protein n=1 Tax=Aphanomyces stellatus TaxID=120398 RepID=A0A485LRV7_9STRA|nr:hypothetical protein As57867_024881 [Aphanomyces stellatus]VFU01590.1 Aste57867_24959 [Aphanomyces stellatus]
MSQSQIKAKTDINSPSAKKYEPVKPSSSKVAVDAPAPTIANGKSSPAVKASTSSTPERKTGSSKPLESPKKTSNGNIQPDNKTPATGAAAGSTEHGPPVDAWAAPKGGNNASSKPAEKKPTEEPNNAVELVEDMPDFETPLGIFGPQFQQRETEDICFAMGMTFKEVEKLIAIFNDIDLNCSGLINLREFYFLLDTPQNDYTNGILRFAAWKSDPKKLDIDDFCRIICSFVLMSQTDVIRFCFELFDEDDSGALDNSEFIHMCESIQIRGEGFFQGNFKRAMDAFDSNHDGLLDLDEFFEMNKKYPLVFWPLFHFQKSMQEKTLGPLLWDKIHQRQLKIDLWRQYMNRYMGRAPPLSWHERWCGFFTKDQRLRLIAAQLYDQDKLKLKLLARTAGAVADKGLAYKRTEVDRKTLKKSGSKCGDGGSSAAALKAKPK